MGQFSEGDKVLAYHGPLIYEANVRHHCLTWSGRYIFPKFPASPVSDYRVKEPSSGRSEVLCALSCEYFWNTSKYRISSSKVQFFKIN